MPSQTTNVVIGVALMIFVGGFVYWQTQIATQATTTPASATEVTENASSNTSGPLESINENGSDQGTTANSQGQESTNQTSSSSTSQIVEITAAQIAQHNSKASCWSSINGKVYDLTSWIPQHPGGESAILSICGIDGSSKFNAQHGGSPLQASILVGFKIGMLAQ